MSAETDPALPQEPGIPGQKTPEQLPEQDEPEVEEVADADQPDVDEEGHMAPPPGEGGPSISERG
jgi:hypothetical protein